MFDERRNELSNNTNNDEGIMNILHEKVKEGNFNDKNEGDVFENFEVTCSCGSKSVTIQIEGGSNCITCGYGSWILLKCRLCGNVEHSDI